MPPEDSYPENENPEHVQSWTSDIRKVNPKMFKENILQGKVAWEDWEGTGKILTTTTCCDGSVNGEPGISGSSMNLGKLLECSAPQLHHRHYPSNWFMVNGTDACKMFRTMSGTLIKFHSIVATTIHISDIHSLRGVIITFCLLPA